MRWRPITRDDYDAVLALVVADEEHVLRRPSRITPGDLREWTSRTNLAEDSWLYEHDGELCAAGWLDALDDVAFAIGIVHPSRRGTGLDVQLAERSEACAAERGAERLHQFSLAADADAARLFEQRGYRPARRFYEMAVELDGRPGVPDVPIESVHERDLRSFYDALDESFQDHWEHHSSTFEEWWGRHSANPGLDLSLWFLVRDGEEVVAVARNEANRNGGGYVGALGVRRPWRGRGYAKALLLHTFREFYDRGTRRVTLGVDSENPTGATHLYEKVGMTVEQESVVYGRAL
jgi:mycothiol synthase